MPAGLGRAPACYHPGPGETASDVERTCDRYGDVARANPLLSLEIGNGTRSTHEQSPGMRTASNTGRTQGCTDCSFPPSQS
jgi:hypothetical protein